MIYALLAAVFLVWAAVCYRAQRVFENAVDELLRLSREESARALREDRYGHAERN